MSLMLLSSNVQMFRRSSLAFEEMLLEDFFLTIIPTMPWEYCTFVETGVLDDLDKRCLSKDLTINQISKYSEPTSKEMDHF